MESPQSSVARFRARGKIFAVPMEVLLKHPDSYLTWVARSHPRLIANGSPIEINKRPEVIQRLLQTYLSVSDPSRRFVECVLHRGTMNGNNVVAQEVQCPEKDEQARMDSRSVVDSVPPSEQPATEYAVAIEGAIRETLRVLQQIRRWGHMQDKALFIYRWGRSANNHQILRPHTVKLYESLTGRLHDVRMSSDSVGGSTSTSSDFLSLTSLDSGAFISPFIQSSITKRIRDAGYSCSFVDVSVDRNGQLVWKGHQVRRAPQSVSSGSIRCLMVNT